MRRARQLVGAAQRVRSQHHGAGALRVGRLRADQHAHDEADRAGVTDAPYGDEARARFVDEPPKRSGRTPFERDRARVVHSAALRRLSAKTQVMGAGFDDFVRNRLTHTLEVAQVARELGKALGLRSGHRRLGRARARSRPSALRSQRRGGARRGGAVLRRVRGQRPDAADPQPARVQGLRRRRIERGPQPTRATLSACVKYPWLRGEAPDASGKFGAYADDVAVFEWLREGAPGHASAHRGAGHGSRGRHRVLGARRRGRRRRRLVRAALRRARS